MRNWITAVMLGIFAALLGAAELERQGWVGSISIDSEAVGLLVAAVLLPMAAAGLGILVALRREAAKKKPDIDVYLDRLIEGNGIRLRR